MIRKQEEKPLTHRCEGYQPARDVRVEVCEWHRGSDNPLGHPDPKCKGCPHYEPKM